MSVPVVKLDITAASEAADPRFKSGRGRKERYWGLSSNREDAAFALPKSGFDSPQLHDGSVVQREDIRPASGEWEFESPRIHHAGKAEMALRPLGKRETSSSSLDAGSMALILEWNESRFPKSEPVGSTPTGVTIFIATGILCGRAVRPTMAS